MDRRKISVLVVDDSRVIRNFLTGILSSDEEIQVVGTAGSCDEALESLKRCKPDVVTMDIHMPGLDGFETTRSILKLYSIPIVIVSGFYQPSEVAMAFKALEVGAVTILPRPSGIGSPDHQESARKFIKNIKLMSEIRVVRRFSHDPVDNVTVSRTSVPFQAAASSLPQLSGIQIVVIGASAGGPQALQEIITGLPVNFPLPILIVQHIDAGFAAGFTVWLQEITGKKITLAKDGTDLAKGGIFLPPGDHHLGVGPDGKISLSKDPPERNLRPSVSFLFRSAIRVFGNRVLGILLTGMGSDGAKELTLIREAGGITIAQDMATSLVHGMPGEAIRMGGAMHIFSPNQIIQFIKNLKAD